MAGWCPDWQRSMVADSGVAERLAATRTDAVVLEPVAGWWWLGCPRRAVTNTSLRSLAGIRLMAGDISPQHVAAGAFRGRAASRASGNRAGRAPESPPQQATHHVGKSGQCARCMWS